ncbi:DUF5329 domain-containing protein [Tahibacter sp.]|uniref:DUF5329 domain-containing protein n=1 Tax=Tahibacter sp. TaxID=2056211 RepID=UPI0028C3D165|nr:DUF5329 domain-containing protein [Tahibacter sp.]
MMYLRRLIGLSLPFTAACVAAPPAAAVRVEIDALLAALSDSGCRFDRNGDWHEAAEARAHLQRKLDHLLKRDAIGTAEEFIERAASRSSISGDAYQVKCGGDAPVASRDWLSGRLAELRKAHD